MLPLGLTATDMVHGDGLQPGVMPTGIVAITVFVAVSITDTVLEKALVT